jgi:DNA-binding transcriptional LysR family regulator
MSDHLEALRLFVRVARKGSFSAAGRDLGVPQPTVSRIIAELEKRIGVALLTRTTRAVTLTEAGVDFLARVEPLLAALEEAEHAARGTGELRGLLRVGVSSSFAVREVAPRLPDFMARHPALRVELMLDDQRTDLVSEGGDLALRLGVLADSSATARKLASWPRVLVAAPAYLAHAGAPSIPADLAAHTLILGPVRGVQAWSFLKGGKAVSVRVEGRLSVSANEAATAAAAAGLGIAQMGLVGCRREIEAGLLERVLPDWDMGLIDLHAVFPAGRAAKPSARAFADFLDRELSPRRAT